jgi:hypothetical protein
VIREVHDQQHGVLRLRDQSDTCFRDDPQRSLGPDHEPDKVGRVGGQQIQVVSAHPAEDLGKAPVALGPVLRGQAARGPVELPCAAEFRRRGARGGVRRPAQVHLRAVDEQHAQLLHVV